MLVMLLWAGRGQCVLAQTVVVHSNALMWAAKCANVGMDRKDGDDSGAKRHTALTAGFVSGYGWMINRHWNVDVVMGAGYLLYADPNQHHKFVPTNFGANLSYVF